tara:strand:- start:1512 stop:3581 length:2070 start_codon:yes stop_codon:yes gene_type:complete
MDSKIEYIFSLFQKGQIDKANEECLNFLKKEPNNFDILHLLGIIFFQKKKYKLSIEYIEKAIKINPDSAEANNNLGIVLKENKLFELSLESFKNAINIDPKYVDAYNNIGIVYRELNKHEKAIDSWKKILKIKPNYIHSYNNIGNIFLEKKNPKLAIDNYNIAISLNKNFFEAYFNKGNAFQELNLHEQAIKNYNEAIKIKSNYAEAYYSKGNSLREMNLLEEAIVEYKNAFKFNSQLKNLLGSLIFTKHNLCNWENYNQEINLLKNEILKKKEVSRPFTVLSIFDSLSLQNLSAQIHVNNKYKTFNSSKKFINKNKNKKIRLAYYSADFRKHAMSYLLVKMFELHDKSKFELFAFSFGIETNDHIQKRISSTFDKFINVREKTDQEIVKLSQEHKIDIAIDLMGFTKLNRFGIFVDKCAPIQINYLGYPGTLGSKCIDYIIADKFLIPKINQKHYSEKIIYLPDSYQVRDSSQKLSEKNYTKKDLGLPENSFIFCCFNRHYKINPKIFSLWMKILNKINGSVLWMLEDNIKTSENLKKEAVKNGINEKRIIFAKRIPIEEHLSRHKAADLFIDTYPYGAHTTCSDALWTGLPVVTLAGDSFASRVAGSILSAINMKELITYSEKEYLDLIIDLATNSEKLNKLKIKLSKNKNSEPLFNTKLYTKNIESSYSKIYENYLKNLPLDNIEI